MTVLIVGAGVIGCALARELASDHDVCVLDRSGVAGAVWYGDTGWADPYTYAVELQRAADRRGVRFETGIAVRAVTEREGRVEIQTSEGTCRADQAVVAAGWRTPELVGEDAETRIPISPYRTQCVVLDPVDSLPGDFPLVRTSGEKVYFRSEHDGTLLGGGYDIVDPRTACSPLTRFDRRCPSSLDRRRCRRSGRQFPTS